MGKALHELEAHLHHLFPSCSSESSKQSQSPKKDRKVAVSNCRLSANSPLQPHVYGYEFRRKVVGGHFQASWICRLYSFSIWLARPPSFTFCPSLPVHRFPNSIFLQSNLIPGFVYLYCRFRHWSPQAPSVLDILTTKSDHSSWSRTVVFALFGVIFGGHCVGWHFKYPTHSEKTQSLASDLIGHHSRHCTNRLPLGHSLPWSWHKFLSKVRTNCASDFGCHRDYPPLHLRTIMPITPPISHCTGTCLAAQPTINCSHCNWLDKIYSSYFL